MKSPEEVKSGLIDGLRNGLVPLVDEHGFGKSTGTPLTGMGG
jgi:hypothetical protein